MKGTATVVQSGETPLPAGSVLTQVSSVLAGIVLLILVIAWLARRVGLTPKTRSSLLNVRASCSLGARERIVVVEVDQRYLVLGVTSQTITHLHTFTPEALPQTQEETERPDFPQALKRVLAQKFGVRGEKA
ncbi:flagellar biosynthetic protein FliO [Enterobacillus tribolii]|uniref:Flagellar protein n=1 Tax=Enterobacillus tribolii TaxID=1487935 RepID=A0A370R2X8_9GAMM|nr:flagellar biosynthetic protein FliO [Enterobacillus tribolii]MBW7984783.1 flagellar biosynthetic protein FliO [Enterobacillus tribolii]RDK96784.1 flagellar protein FliO/FliZ [Enterobacillus tribolii]